MRLLTDPRLPQGQSPTDQQQLVLRLTSILRDVTTQLNQITEGRIAAVQNADTAAPVSGQNSQGDFVLNKTPTELGTAGSKYIVHGWRCTVSGSPGTWVQVRTLTGN